MCIETGFKRGLVWNWKCHIPISHQTQSGNFKSMKKVEFAEYWAFKQMDFKMVFLTIPMYVQWASVCLL
jgi:hypothetical protein